MKRWVKGLRNQLLKWKKSLLKNTSNDLDEWMQYPLDDKKAIGLLTDDEIEEQAIFFFRGNL